MLQRQFLSGSDYYNYKSFHSTVLFTLVDANYIFLFVDISCQGLISDGGVFKNSKLHEMIERKNMNLPANNALPGREHPIPYVILADEAFPLRENIMKPYSGVHKQGSNERIFNYRLSRARRDVENVFGITSSIFRILLLEPEKAQLLVLTIAYLHNFLRSSKYSRNTYTPAEMFDREASGTLVLGTWRTNVDDNRASLLPLSNIPRRSPAR